MQINFSHTRTRMLKALGLIFASSVADSHVSMCLAVVPVYMLYNRLCTTGVGQCLLAIFTQILSCWLSSLATDMFAIFVYNFLTAMLPSQTRSGGSKMQNPQGTL